jgi:hypothetical protein
MLSIFPLAAGNSRFLDPLADTEASIKYLERSKSRGFQEVFGLLLRIPYYRAYRSHLDFETSCEALAPLHMTANILRPEDGDQNTLSERIFLEHGQQGC